MSSRTVQAQRFLEFSLALHAGSENITRYTRITGNGVLVPSYYVGGKLKMEIWRGHFSTVTFFRGGKKGSRQTSVFLMDNEVQSMGALQAAFQWAVGLRGGISYKRVLELMLEAQPEAIE